MNLYQYGDNEVISVIDRCYVEVAQGRSRLAVDRLKDLEGKFPGHPNVLYALGQIHRDNLGVGKEAYRYFNLAYDSAIKQKSKSETAWFCVCNLAHLSPTEIDFRKWTNTAIQMKGANQDECKSYADDVTDLDKGASYIDILIGRYMSSTQRDNNGDVAALAEIILQTASNAITPEIRIEMIKTRMICLRHLDETAWNQRKCMAEDFPPDERITLPEAIQECQRIIEIDPYEATYWNYKSAWHLLLWQYDECIRCADQAITLRPYHYPRPHVNKSAALREIGDMAAALVSAKEALAQAPESELGPEVTGEAKYAVFLSSQPKSIPSLDDLAPQIEKILTSAMETSQKDIERFRGVLNLDDVAGTVMSHIRSVGDRPFYGYAPKVSELLMMFTPETAFVASLRISEINAKTPIVDYCTAAAWYVMCIADGVLRRDAARYLVLMTLYLGHPEAIRQYYRQAFLAPSAAAREELAKADSIIRAELFRIHPGLPALIADQSPATADERDIAIRNILRHFDNSVSCRTSLADVSISSNTKTRSAGGLLNRFFGLFRKNEENRQCEMCSNRMTVIDFSGSGSVALTNVDIATGIGHAEQCWECGRLYCADCYPTRPPNTCICGRGRNTIRQIGGTTYKGSLRLVKVKYTNKGRVPEGNIKSPSKKLQSLVFTIEELKFSQDQIDGLLRTLKNDDPELFVELMEYVQRNQNG